MQKQTTDLLLGRNLAANLISSNQQAVTDSQVSAPKNKQTLNQL